LAIMGFVRTPLLPTPHGHTTPDPLFKPGKFVVSRYFGIEIAKNEFPLANAGYRQISSTFLKQKAVKFWVAMGKDPMIIWGCKHFIICLLCNYLVNLVINSDFYRIKMNSQTRS